ncbi:MAG TPA: DUF4397 domain-containing protein [Acidobacteriaceae bacterium]|jgi:hypothetical protein
MPVRLPRVRGAVRRRWCVGTISLVGMVLAGCQSISMSPDSVAQVRVVAASPDAGSMDFYAGGTALAYGVDFGSASTYVPLQPGSVRLSANTASSTQMLIASNAGLVAGRQYTAVVANVAASLQETIYADQTTPAPAGEVAVRVIDAATRAGNLDLYMVPAGGRLTATAAVRAGVVFGASTGYVLLPAGTYSLVIVPAGTAPTNQALPLMTAPQTTYAAGAVQTVVLVDHPNPQSPGVDQIVTSDYDPQETRQ